MTTKRYAVEQYGDHYFVRDSVTRHQHGPYRSRLAASGAMQELEICNISPEEAGRLHLRAAYRQVKTPGTELYALRMIFPKLSKREIEERVKADFRGHPVFQGVNWDAIDEAQKTAAGQRRAGPATKKNAEKGLETEDRIRAAWARLPDVPSRNRAARIARDLDLTAQHVRRIVKKLQLR